MQRLSNIPLRKIAFYITLCFFVLCFSSINAATDAVITIPKTGTNLIIKCIKLIKEIHGDKEGLDWMHQWKAGKNDNFSIGPTDLKVKYIKKNAQKVIIIVRDPRDFVCALARVTRVGIGSKKLSDIIQFPGKYLSKVALNHPFFRTYNSFTSLYEEYLQWGQYSFVYTTYFEKLIGPNGGGSFEEQIQEILNISNHLNKPLTYDEACSVANEVFGGTPTFKQGKSHDWKNKFSTKNIQEFNDNNHGLIKLLGYEN